ncbi:hypothetical protein KDN32_08190 [Nocardioides sp. J2M5]|uniref:hypothetical protein n=1 Tax=Nocardioides palaemonis TaxID=2829810 RepID=UPI001BAAA62C|nr:hypothetical protein [Nocardioides palaemonis]MBS2937720.1 hypothetical protein [Nocardioides palaemonis]
MPNQASSSEAPEFLVDAIGGLLGFSLAISLWLVAGSPEVRLWEWGVFVAILMMLIAVRRSCRHWAPQPSQQTIVGMTARALLLLVSFISLSMIMAKLLLPELGEKWQACGGTESATLNCFRNSNAFRNFHGAAMLFPVVIQTLLYATLTAHATRKFRFNLRWGTAAGCVAFGWLLMPSGLDLAFGYFVGSVMFVAAVDETVHWRH